MTSYVTAQGLVLQRGDLPLCRGLSLEIDAGECIHLEGPNGSGKTTLFHVLCGLLAPEDGEVKWHAGPVSRQAHFCAHQNGLKDAWTVSENLRWAMRLNLCRTQEARWEKVIDDMRLGELVDTPVSQLSQGEKRRTALARLGLIPRPVWLLDEPFTALDVESQSRFADWVNDHVMRGGAVLFSNHGPLPEGLQVTRRKAIGAAL